MAVIINATQLPDYIGKTIGTSSWLTITQEQINSFADTTLDHQFIHIDPEKAKQTPFGTTIAHGFLSLSLLSAMSFEAGLHLENTTMGINYGFDKIRFLQPVKVNSKVRGNMTLSEYTEKRPGEFLLKWLVEVEIEGESKPALTAQWLSMIMVSQ
ncbi:MaoC family dehydratase [uncultured Paraglaciecola sp.]|uniref:MaoC family dehydratase n=1 Tax=uncultured Paraglaciecola sp. TaxID=1765024 RepID=UPI00260657F0|nr:MaoC family dehydratase [uncultured Paraglaciecola sp.]